MADLQPRARHADSVVRRPTTRGRWLVVALVAVLALGSGCSDDPSPEEQVCDARSELREALDAVADDVTAANFGDASDDLSAVGDAYDQLAAAVGDLAQEQRDALAPQVDALESDIAALADVQNLDELGPALDAVVSQAETIFDDITDTLNCS